MALPENANILSQTGCSKYRSGAYITDESTLRIAPRPVPWKVGGSPIGLAMEEKDALRVRHTDDCVDGDRAAKCIYISVGSFSDSGDVLS